MQIAYYWGKLRLLRMAWKATDKFALLISAKDAGTSWWGKARLCLAIRLPTNCRPELRFLADTKELFVAYLALQMLFKRAIGFELVAMLVFVIEKEPWLACCCLCPALPLVLLQKSFVQAVTCFSHTLSLLVKFCLKCCKVKKNYIDGAVVASRDWTESRLLWLCVNIVCETRWCGVAGAWLGTLTKFCLAWLLCMKKKGGWVRSKLCEVRKKKKTRQRVVGLVTGHTGVTV